MVYDPEPKKKRKAWIALILAYLGLSAEEDIPPAIMSLLTWQTAQDVIRDLQTQILVEANVAEYKDWAIEDENACELCKEYAAASPYRVEVAGPETHPNCRCYWVPHVE